MPHFDIIKESEIPKTFRNEYVKGKFDVQTNEIKETFKGEIDLSKDWKIGLILGSSGSGKSTIAKQLFPNQTFKHKYSNQSIFDEMPKNVSCDDIARAFTSCGFSSPPSWLKPYHVLSNGEKMRVDLAYCMLSDEKTIIFDEFTSVVDRTIAHTACVSINKAIHRSDKKFIAISCHDDVRDWLEPDWVFNTESMSQSYDKKKDQNLNSKSMSDLTNHYGSCSGVIII